MTREQAHRALAGVRAEFDAARAGVEEILARISRGAHAAIPAATKVADLRQCAQNLEITYILRLFAEFEGVLRDYWIGGRKRKTVPNMRPLMNSIAAYRDIPPDD